MRIRIAVLIIILIGGISLFVLVSDQGCEGEEIIVSQSGEGDAETINEALDTALDGDTIRVMSGTYEERLVIDKRVNISRLGTGSATIRGTGEGDVIQITSDNVTLVGFIVELSGTRWGDAGVMVSGKGATLKDLKCINNDIGVFLDKVVECKVENVTCESNNWGIYLREGGNNTIVNSTFEENLYQGISLSGSKGNLIRNNSVGYNGNGIGLYSDADNNTLEENGCGRNSLTDDSKGLIIQNSNGNLIQNNSFNFDQIGILCEYSSNNQFLSNECYSNDKAGISFFSSSGDLLIGNEITYNTDGISLGASKDIIIQGTIMKSNGIILDSITMGDWEGIVIDTSNLVKGKPVYFLTNESGIVVPERAGQIILLSCSNVTITGQSISDTTTGILIGRSVNITIENSTSISNNRHGIHIWNSNHCIVESVDTSRNDMNGIYAEFSKDVHILNSTVEDNLVGIYLQDNYVGHLIKGNHIDYNDFGIVLNDSSLNNIEDNDIRRSYEFGVLLTQASRYNQVHYNSFWGNGYGMASEDSQYNTDARYNYWESVDGPRNSEKNPFGSGGRVSDNIIFSPWLDQWGVEYDLDRKVGDEDDEIWKGESLVWIILIVFGITRLGVFIKLGK